MAIGTASLPGRIAFEAPPDVRAALDSLGRTEDLRFSPSGRRLAIACYQNQLAAIADIEIGDTPAGPTVAVARVERFVCGSLPKPHGIDFLDEETLVVAARDAGVGVYRLPAPGSSGGGTQLEPLGGIALDAAEGPGSVMVDRSDPGAPAVLVCNNWSNRITRHAVGADGTVGEGEVIVGIGLDLPDGLVLSHDRRWLAVSNHNVHTVHVYAYPTREDAGPAAVLRGVLYPHGMRFSADDRRLVVADAGRAYAHAFTSPDDGWRGARYAEATFRVMDDETLARGHANPQEGGPKGIDLHPHRELVAVTAEHQPLAFFDLDAALADPDPHEARMDYELSLLENHRLFKATATEQHAELNEGYERIKQLILENSRLRNAYERSLGRRLTKPFRALASRTEKR